MPSIKSNPLPTEKEVKYLIIWAARSVPPVVPRYRKAIPIPAPARTPPYREASKGLSVNGVTNRPQYSTAKAKSVAPKKVFAPNFVPKIFKQAKNKGVFKEKITTLTGHPHR